MSQSHRRFKVKNHGWLRIPCILALLLFLQMETGALVGGAIGGTLGGLAAYGFCERGARCILAAAAGVALVGGIGAGTGAGIGVAIDAIINRSTTVYRAKPGRAARFNIAPVLSKESTGIALSISF